MLSLLVIEPLSPALQTPPSRFVFFLIFVAFVLNELFAVHLLTELLIGYFFWVIPDMELLI